MAPQACPVCTPEAAASLVWVTVTDWVVQPGGLLRAGQGLPFWAAALMGFFWAVQSLFLSMMSCAGHGWGREHGSVWSRCRREDWSLQRGQRLHRRVLFCSGCLLSSRPSSTAGTSGDSFSGSGGSDSMVGVLIPVFFPEVTHSPENYFKEDQ